ncbi:MAG: hypothetical protein V4738_08710 [Pseudomonadota bacterium]
MRIMAIAAALVATATLSGCVVYPYGYGGRHGGRYYEQQQPVYQTAPVYRGDRDRDGVPNRYDRRPGNPYRY